MCNKKARKEGPSTISPARRFANQIRATQKVKERPDSKLTPSIVKPDDYLNEEGVIMTMQVKRTRRSSLMDRATMSRLKEMDTMTTYLVMDVAVPQGNFLCPAPHLQKTGTTITGVGILLKQE